MVSSTASVGDIPVPGERLCGLTWMQQHLWFSDAGLEQILAVAPQTGQIVKRIACPGVRTDLANIDGRLLQIAGPAKSLRVIDPDTGQTVTEFPNPRPGAELCGLDVATEGVWMGYRDPQLIDLRRRSDFSLISSIQVEEAVAGLTVFGRFVAFANYSNARISVLDPSLTASSKFPAGGLTPVFNEITGFLTMSPKRPKADARFEDLPGPKERMLMRNVIDESGIVQPTVFVRSDTFKDPHSGLNTQVLSLAVCSGVAKSGQEPAAGGRSSRARQEPRGCARNDAG